MPLFTPDRPDVLTDRAPALAAARAANSDSRWARWATAGARHDSMGRRSGWLIASVVAAGTLTWLVGDHFLNAERFTSSGATTALANAGRASARAGSLTSAALARHRNPCYRRSPRDRPYSRHRRDPCA